MKQIIIFILIILGMLGTVQAISLENVTLTSGSNNASLSFTKSVNVSNVTLNANNIILDDFGFTNSENFTLANNTVVSNFDFTWDESNSLVDSINFLDYFRFNLTSTGTLLSDWVFNSFNSSGNELRLFFTALGSEGSKTWLWEKFGYISTSFGFNFSRSSFNNITFNVSFATIDVNIYDRQTGNLLTGLTELTLVGPLGQNTSTTTGIAQFQNLNLQVGDYQIIATHSGYATESAFFTFDNQEQLGIDIYMLNTSAATYGTISITAKDEFSQFVPGAICKANEWNTDASAYLPVAQGKTNGNGQTTLNIEIGTKLYEFTCQKGGIIGSIPEEIIFADLEERTIIIRQTITDNLPDFESITASATENVVGNFTTVTYTFSNSLGTNVEACLKYYRVRGNSKSRLNSTCVTSSSGTIIEMVAINNTYNLLIEATIDIDSKVYLVNSFPHKSINDISFSLANYGLDKFVMPIAIILCIVLVFFTKIQFVGEFLGIVVLWIGVGFVTTIMSVTIATIGSVILLLMMYWGYKTK